MFIRLDTEGLSIEEKEGLFEKGLNMYHVINTLTTHGDHESVILPELRKNEKLIAI